MSSASFKKLLRLNGATAIAVWTVFVLTLTSGTVYYHHLDTLQEAESEARDYLRLNKSYRSWAASLGGFYVPVDKIAPNPYLRAPRRDISTDDGQKLTLVNPAYMTRMVFDLLKSSSPNPVISKITSLKPLNPGNAPDHWESEALAAFDRGEASECSQVTTLNSQPYLRLITRFMTEQPCLACHSIQGYRVGDVRGGITISIPLTGYYAAESRTRGHLLAGYLLIWLTGSCGIAVTSRRRLAIEDELRASEEKFRTVCDWTQDWEYWIDEYGTMKYNSPSCLELTGYTAEEFRCDPELVLRLVHPEDREAFSGHLVPAAPAHRHATESIEFRIVTREGAVRWMHHVCRPVYADDRYLGNRASNRDITDRKLAERLNVSFNRISAFLMSSNSDQHMYRELLTTLLDIMQSPIGLVGYLDQSGSLVCPAPTGGGWSSKEQTRASSVVFQPALWSGSIWGEALLSGQARYSNEPQQVPEGHVAIGRCLVVPLLNRGRTIGLMMVANRETDYDDDDLRTLSAIGVQVVPVMQARLDQRQAIEALRENESKLRVIFDVIQAGIIEVNAQGTVTFANQRMAEMLGMSMSELLGSSYGSHICQDQLQAAELSLKQLLDGERDCVHLERHYQRKDGSEFWGYLSGRVLGSPERKNPVLVGTVSDMTELKSAEEKRHKSEQQMLHVQKLESLGVLAGGIAHDFNNILLAIMGNASLALHRLPDDSPAQQHLRQIEQAAEKAADLARQMLAYSGKGRFVLEALDLNRLIREMTSMLEVTITKKVELRFHLAEELPAIIADATQIRQIVMNLAINASEAIGEASGIISFATGWRTCDREYLAETWLNDELPAGRYVFLEVSDTGCGMEPSTVERIFEPFFTTKFTGRGLGMAAILGIVRGHKGAIKVYTEPGNGSSFKVYFPASERAADEASPHSADLLWRGKGTVLLVDDEETVRAVGTEMLGELGFQVLTAADGVEALQLYRARGREIAIVLMDLNMPHLNGEETFHELRRIDPQVRVLLSSGFSEQEVTRKFLGQGLAGFVQKPYTLDILRESLSRLF
jgi:two-component system, cell cycle sensor histidine kinase and response regulator CckA